METNFSIKSQTDCPIRQPAKRGNAVCQLGFVSLGKCPKTSNNEIPKACPLRKGSITLIIRLHPDSNLER